MNAAIVRHGISIAAGAAIVAALGCSDSPVEPRVPLTVTLDQERYVGIPYIDGRAGWSFRLITTITNVTDAPQRLPSCGGRGFIWSFGVAEGDARSAWQPVFACPGSDDPRPVLAARAARVDTMVMRAPTSTSGLTGEILGQLQGRFIFGILTEQGVATSAPVAVAIAAVSR